MWIRRIAKMAALGAVLGLPISLLIGWMVKAPFDRIFAHPVFWVITSATIGVIFSLAFYGLVAMPMHWLGSLLREFIPWFSGTARVRLTTNEELDVSRERARELKSAMGL